MTVFQITLEAPTAATSGQAPVGASAGAPRRTSPNGHLQRLIGRIVLSLAICIANVGVHAPAAQDPGSADSPPSSVSDLPQDDNDLTEITVQGELPGPGLWVVRNGERSLYLLGTMSPLPKDLTWRSRQVEEVLSRAQMLIPSRGDVSSDIGPLNAVGLYFRYRSLRNNPGKSSLADVLEPPLFEQFEAQRKKYAPRDRSLLERRPVLAAGELWRAAIDRNGLSLRNQVNRQVEKLAEKNGVPIVRPRLRIDDARGTLDEVARIPLKAEIDCMAATLNRFDSDLAQARQRAQAWAVGDISALRIGAVAAQQEACWSALLTSPKMAELRKEFDEAWLSTAVMALEGQTTTLAVVPLIEILKPNGIVAQMRARGYTVEEPS